MTSVPNFVLSSVIPEPSSVALGDFRPLAILTWGDDMLAYYWWTSERKVILWAQRYNLWLQQDDLKIRNSIADVLGCESGTLETWNMMLYDSPAYHHAVHLPEKIAELFLDCEWSDYACDCRPVTGQLSIKFVDAHSPTDSEESLCDDDAPPSPRRWRRWRHLDGVQ